MILQCRLQIFLSLTSLKKDIGEEKTSNILIFLFNSLR